MLLHWQSWHGVGNQQQQMRTSRIEIMRKMVMGYPRRRVQVVIMFLPLFMIMNKTGKGKRSAYADATGGIGRCEQQKSMFSIINISQYPCLGRDLSSRSQMRRQARAAIGRTTTAVERAFKISKGQFPSGRLPHSFCP